MKKLFTLLLLASTYCQAQSSFFVGANGSMNSTTLLNKEDKSAPKGMLNKKNGIQPGYGIQLGYSINNRFAISIEPNRLQYKVNYSGTSDTANVRSFEATARFTYYQLPLVLTYKQPITERLSINAGVGMSYNYMSSYKEEFEGKKTLYGNPSQIYTNYFYNSDKKGYDEARGFSDGKVDILYSSPLYTKTSLGIFSTLNFEYSISKNVSIRLQCNYQRGIKEIENRNMIDSKVTYQESGQILNYSTNYWTETNYYRYYSKNYMSKESRASTYTQALGLGIGINYYFKGGLLHTSN